MHDTRPEALAFKLVPGHNNESFIACKEHVRKIIATAIRRDRAECLRAVQSLQVKQPPHYAKDWMSGWSMGVRISCGEIRKRNNKPV